VGKAHVIVALGLAGFFGVAACTATSQSPPSPPQATSQPASPATSQPASPASSQPASPASSQPASPATSQPGAGTIRAVTDQSFDEEVLKSGKPVVVEYWAEWCGPCRMGAPVLEEIAAEHSDKITVVKLNVDENPAVPERYGIVTIPTMDVFSNGQMVKRIVGVKPKPALLRELAGFI